MPVTVENPVSKVFDRWSVAVRDIVGNNYSMNDRNTILKTPYARLLMLGNPTDTITLEGDEISTIPSFQCDSFASGQKATSMAYEIDDISHKAMINMGFKRTYGPELLDNSDRTIKRVVSRYSRVYSGILV